MGIPVLFRAGKSLLELYSASSLPAKKIPQKTVLLLTNRLSQFIQLYLFQAGSLLVFCQYITNTFYYESP